MPEDETRRFEAAAAVGAGRPLDGLTRQNVALADAIFADQQAQFLRTHSSAGGAPASGWAHAQGLVTVRRTTDLHQDRYVAAGSMVLDGPNARRYVNYASQFFERLDGASRDVLFVCEVPGTVGNLDAWGDGAGYLTNEGTGDAPNTPAVLAHANLSADRSNTGATIVPAADPTVASVIKDSGFPDQFLPQHVNLYVEIVDSDQPGNIGKVLRVLEHRAPLVEDPAGSGLYPTWISVDDRPISQHNKWVLVDDGGVFTDYTVAASEDAPDDVPLFPSPATVNDAIYFGNDTPFIGLWVAVTTPATGDYILRYEYWNGVSWVSFGPTDDTVQWSLAGEGYVRWTPGLVPGWSTTAVNGVTAYWIRVRVGLVVLVTQEPLAAEAKALFDNRLLAGTCHWKMLDWRGLGFELESIAVMSGGRDPLLDMHAEERGAAPRQSFESDDLFRERIAELADVVSPNAIQRIVNRSLEPYGMEGLAIDAYNGFDGLFIDVDALDYYSPGDIYPENPWKLYTTQSEAFGWFWIILPCLSDGEFGTSYDDGPVKYLEPETIFLGPAYEYGFFDGFPVDAEGVYASIYNAVDQARAAGIGFTMFRSCDLNLKKC